MSKAAADMSKPRGRGLSSTAMGLGLLALARPGVREQAAPVRRAAPSAGEAGGQPVGPNQGTDEPK